MGDWIGIPLNEAGLARSEAWDASIQSLPEWQCRPHGWAYIYRGPTALRIWRDIDPFTREVTAFHAQWQQAAETPIYLMVVRIRQTTRHIPGWAFLRRSGKATF